MGGARRRRGRRVVATMLALLAAAAVLSLVVAPGPSAQLGTSTIPNPPTVFPKPGGPVSVTQGPGAEPCPPLRRVDAERYAGGCVVKARSSEIEMTIDSMVGEMPFGACRSSFELRVDGRGRTALTKLTFAEVSPCNDTFACWDQNKTYAWLGRIVSRDGELVHLVDACIHNCMGRFEGQLELRLGPVPAGWRARAADAPMGTSGFELDGAWSLAAGGLDIRG